MKILMVVRWPVGGIRSFLRYTFSDPCFHDCALELICPDPSIGPFLATEVSAESLRHTVVENSIQDIAIAARRALRHQSFDLIHSHGFTAALLTQVATFGSRIPHLMTAHDVFLPSTFASKWGILKRFALVQAFDRLDCIHAVSDDCSTNLLEYLPNLSREKIISIRNGIDVNRFLCADPIDVHTELNLDSSISLIGFFGRFMGQKGFRTLVDAIAQLTRGEHHPRLRVVFSTRPRTHVSKSGFWLYG